MLLSRLAEVSSALRATRSRNAKRDLIASVLADATADDIAIVVSYLGGSLRQRRTGLGWRSLPDQPLAADEATLTVIEVDAAMSAIAELSGSGSAGARVRQAADLFGRATELEQSFLRGLIFGELRQGALDALVQDGLAQAYAVPVATVRRAAMLLSSTTAVAELLLGGGESALAQVGLQVGVPIQPMLAASAPDAGDAAGRIGLPAVADVKLDGIRIQVHRDGSSVQIFTRSLDEITPRLPEVVKVLRELPVQRLVLDGEVLALREDGRPEAFQITASRTATSADVAAVSSRVPLRAYFFDLLHIDGQDLLNVPLEERSHVMARLLPPELIVPRRLVTTEDELEAVFARAIADGYEGLVVKRPGAPYAAGRREASWIKIKPRHTFDLVVTAVEWGSGRRRGWLSNLHLAARQSDSDGPDSNGPDSDGPDSDGFVMLGKTFKGLTDELLAWQTAHFLALEQRRDAHTVYVKPTTVVQIACDGLQVSRRYPGGVALRFARVLRYREDKSASDADTLDTVRLLLGPPLET